MSKDKEERFKARSELLLEQAVKAGVPEGELRAFLGTKEEYQTTADMMRTRNLLRRLEKGEKWETIRDAGLEKADQHQLDQHPRRAPFHDILFVRRIVDEDDVDHIGAADEDASLPTPYRYHQFRAIKDGPGRGGFRAPKGEVFPDTLAADDGYRAVLDLAITARGTSDERGPILSALPLNPDPAASSSCTCYLLNPSNLNYATAWTAEEWSDRPGDEGAPLPPGKDVFSVLIASPGGKVYYLEKKTEDELKDIDNAQVTLREVTLSQEPEIWSQLRSGSVIGRALYNGPDASRKVTPLVNIHSLIPAPESQQ